MTKIFSVLFVSAFIVLSNQTQASQLMFQGQNAGIFPSANPADTSQLMLSVAKPTQSTATPSVSPSTLVEQSVLSQISSKIYQDIFNSPSNSGSFDLGTGSTISYLKAGGNITITIYDPVNGKTVITVPNI